MKVQVLLRSLLIPSLLLILQACGGQRWVVSDNIDDPDTKELVARENRPLLEGSWKIPASALRDSLSIIWSFHHDTYQVSALDAQGKALASDFGRLIHVLPGTVHLESTSTQCQSKNSIRVLDFKRIQESLRFSDPDTKLNLTAQRDEGGQFPLADMCIWKS